MKKTTNSLDHTWSLRSFRVQKVTGFNAELARGVTAVEGVLLFESLVLRSLWEVFLTYNGAGNWLLTVRDLRAGFLSYSPFGFIVICFYFINRFELATWLLWRLKNVPRNVFTARHERKEHTRVWCQVSNTYVCKFLFQPVCVKYLIHDELSEDVRCFSKGLRELLIRYRNYFLGHYPLHEEYLIRRFGSRFYSRLQMILTQFFFNF